MTARPWRWLGVLLAFLTPAAVAHARQVQPVKPVPPVSKPPVEAAAADSQTVAAADSLRNVKAQARIDSIAKAKAADTVKTPFARFEAPMAMDAVDRLQFSRAELLATGAMNLADLLDRVPGVTTYRTGWLAGIHAATYHGDQRRIRIFFDGMERDAIEARNGGMLDLDDIPLWALDGVRIERTAGEVRVWLTGWTVRKTIPYSRVDIFTGDLNTNGFRAHFGRRFANGFALQFVGQQMATQSGRVSAFTTQETTRGAGDGSQQLLDVRLGWARARWTIDVQGTSSTRDRDPKTARTEAYTSLPAYRGSRREGFARVAYGDTLGGLWGQLLVGALATRLDGIGSSTADSTVRRDTLGARTQQLLVVGYRGRWWQTSIIDRMRPVDGRTWHAPAVRAGLTLGAYRLEAVAERRALDSLATIDVRAVARPLRWLTLTGAHSLRMPTSAVWGPNMAASRAEAHVAWRGITMGAGMIHEEPNRLTLPILFGPSRGMISAVASNGIVASLSGPLYKAITVDVQAVRWDAAQYFRPQLSVRSEVALRTNWLEQFPKGQFSINARVMHEVRDPVPFAWTAAGAETARIAQSYQLLTGLLELRIQNATLFYQYRNMTGTDYEQIPGILMPPAVQMYGVRWEFSN